MPFDAFGRARSQKYLVGAGCERSGQKAKPWRAERRPEKFLCRTHARKAKAHDRQCGARSVESNALDRPCNQRDPCYFHDDRRFILPFLRARQSRRGNGEVRLPRRRGQADSDCRNLVWSHLRHPADGHARGGSHDSLSRWRSGDARACGRAVLFSNHLWRSRVARSPAARCANPFASSPAANLNPTFSRPLAAWFVKLARLYSVAPAAG